ncbi:MAG: Kelch repeat-containing protein, partial [Chloroflexota bacterium]
MRTWVAVLAAVAMLFGPAGLARSGSGVQAQTGTWTSMAPLPIAKTGLVAVTGVDGRIYVFGGTDNATQDYSDSEVYDPASNAWHAIAPLPMPESYASAELGLDGKIYIIGGFDSLAGQSLNTVFAYNPTTNSYACSGAYAGCSSTSLAPMPTARSVMAIAETDDGKIWTIGGYTSTPVATVEVYDPAANTWTEGPALPTPLSGGAAMAFPTGHIVLWGGFDGHQNNQTPYVLPPLAPSTLNTRDTVARPVRKAIPLQQQTGLEQWWCRFPPEEQAAKLRWVGEHQDQGFNAKKTAAIPGWVWRLVLVYRNDVGGRALEAVLRESCSGYGPGSESRAELLAPGQHHTPEDKTHQPASTISLPPVVFAGGESGSGVSNSVSIYDWLKDSVSAGPALPGPREAAAEAYAPFASDGAFYVIGGDDGTHVYNTVFSYKPPLLTLNLAPASTATPTSAPVAVATSTAMPTAPPTSTPTPVPTAEPTHAAAPTPLPITVRLKIRSHRLAPEHI